MLYYNLEMRKDVYKITLVNEFEILVKIVQQIESQNQTLVRNTKMRLIEA